jgi:hypothetical protein
MGTYGNTVAAAKAALGPTLHQGRIAILFFQGYDQCRTYIGADAVTVTTLAIDLQQGHGQGLLPKEGVR